MEEQFAFAREAGFNIMRIFYTPVDEKQAIMTAPGELTVAGGCREACRRGACASMAELQATLTQKVVLQVVHSAGWLI